MALLVLHGRNPYHYRFYMAGINIIMSQVVSNKITPWAILRNICEDHVRSRNQKWGWGPYNLGSQDWLCSRLILNCGPRSAMSWLTPCFSFHPKKEKLWEAILMSCMEPDKQAVHSNGMHMMVHSNGMHMIYSVHDYSATLSSAQIYNQASLSTLWPTTLCQRRNQPQC